MLSACADEYEAKHAFSAFANWVIPGRLMVGRYPYVEGSRCRCSFLGGTVTASAVHLYTLHCMHSWANDAMLQFEGARRGAVEAAAGGWTDHFYLPPGTAPPTTLCWDTIIYMLLLSTQMQQG